MKEIYLNKVIEDARKKIEGGMNYCFHEITTNYTYEKTVGDVTVKGSVRGSDLNLSGLEQVFFKGVELVELRLSWKGKSLSMLPERENYVLLLEDKL